MPTATEPRYVIFAKHAGEDDAMLAAPLEPGDRDYFVSHIVPALRPMTDEQYGHGPAVILHTLARFSYILFGRDVYWCSEWDPGLIVVRFSPDRKLAWAAFRSPIPDFGGQKATEEDLRDYDDTAENHQYNLVFRAWDAQFDGETRKWNLFERADDETRAAFEAATQHVDELGEALQARYSAQHLIERWCQQCEENLRAWSGDGIRVEQSTQQ